MCVLQVDIFKSCDLTCTIFRTWNTDLSSRRLSSDSECDLMQCTDNVLHLMFSVYSKLIVTANICIGVTFTQFWSSGPIGKLLDESLVSQDVLEDG